MCIRDSLQRLQRPLQQVFPLLHFHQLHLRPGQFNAGWQQHQPGNCLLYTSSADVGIIALGMGLVVITGQIDLSVGSMLAFVGGCTIMVYNVTNSILLAFLAAVVCGTVCGLINGVLVGRAKMPAFIATLATMLIYRSLTRYICSEIPTTLSGGSNSLFKLMRGDKIVSALKLHEGTDMYKVFYNFGNGKFLGLPVTGIFLLMITIVIVYVLSLIHILARLAIRTASLRRASSRLAR